MIIIDNILVNPPVNSGILDCSKITSHVFLKQFGKADHQPCILAIDIELKKIHPPKFIKYRKAIDNAEEKMKLHFTSQNILDRLKNVTDPEKSYQVLADSISEA